jgi:predicted DNA-binding protein (UPF0251 family)
VPRPPCCRRVMGKPAASLFTPAGSRSSSAEQVVVSLDEFEAIRLADCEGLKQEDAAEQMQVSRPTFGRVLESAHRKVADSLVHGKPLKIEGGPVCTLDSCGPRDCPRWRRRGAGASCSEEAAPCGRGLPARRRKARTSGRAGHGAPLKKGERL